MLLYFKLLYLKFSPFVEWKQKLNRVNSNRMQTKVLCKKRVFHGVSSIDATMKKIKSSVEKFSVLN